MLPRVSFFCAAGCGLAMLVGAAGAQKEAVRPADVLEGTLGASLKPRFPYFIEGFGDGQKCALFLADDRLKNIEPRSFIRVRGHLGSRYFGPNPMDPHPAVSPTWVIYMDVDDVEVLRKPPKVFPPLPPAKAS
jgi:hypothetical protein